MNNTAQSSSWTDAPSGVPLFEAVVHYDVDEEPQYTLEKYYAQLPKGSSEHEVFERIKELGAELAEIEAGNGNKQSNDDAPNKKIKATDFYKNCAFPYRIIEGPRKEVLVPPKSFGTKHEEINWLCKIYNPTLDLIGSVNILHPGITCMYIRSVLEKDGAYRATVWEGKEPGNDGICHEGPEGSYIDDALALLLQELPRKFAHKAISYEAGITAYNDDICIGESLGFTGPDNPNEPRFLGERSFHKLRTSLSEHATWRTATTQQSAATCGTTPETTRETEIEVNLWKNPYVIGIAKYLYLPDEGQSIDHNAEYVIRSTACEPEPTSAEDSHLYQATLFKNEEGKEYPIEGFAAVTGDSLAGALSALSLKVTENCRICRPSYRV
ncbi:hypothetical protein CC80DRAFT_566922 [Byssothecium circinans]|uniref:Uncharacterized protein n=1 Tax=Byssothecium circinans TaxID=147558 RepID=A0A6A5TW16_9PLEO|nr:hypothetical protein CC80DRAFT_566922 [Byssothecium circinans]